VPVTRNEDYTTAENALKPEKIAYLTGARLKYIYIFIRDKKPQHILQK